MPSTAIRVIIVDDHPVVRFGLAAIIGLQPDMSVVAEAGSGEEALEVCAKRPADIVLMDLRLPGLSGLEAIRTLRKSHPKIRPRWITALSPWKAANRSTSPLRPTAPGLSRSSAPTSCTE